MRGEKDEGRLRGPSKRETRGRKDKEIKVCHISKDKKA